MAQTAATVEKYIGKTLPITVTMFCFEKNCYEAMKKDFCWLVLHSGVQNKITTTF